MNSESLVSLPLSQLRVNPQNPRYRDSRDDEHQAILHLFLELKPHANTAANYMLNLMQDIAGNGLNPSELPLVAPDPNNRNTYLVLEGNRRISCLKLLYRAELSDAVFSSHPQIAKRIPGIRSQFLSRYGDQYASVTCAVVQESEQARHWIYLRHTGENEGRGVSPWDKAAKDQFRLQAQVHQYTTATQIVGLLVNEGLLDTETPVVLSTVERMVNDPDVASRLGISFLDGTVQTPADPTRRGFALQVLRRIAIDTTERDPVTRRKRLTSRHINDKEERGQYLATVITQIGDPLAELEDSPITQQEPATAQPEYAPEGKVGVAVAASPKGTDLPMAPSPSLRPPASKDWQSRTSVAVKGIKISHSRLSHLYRELCQLDSENFVNVGSIGIRVFLEGSLDVFMSRFADEAGLSKSGGDPYRLSMSNKVSQVAKFLETGGYLDAASAQAIRKYEANRDTPLHTDTLNAYLHNPELEPSGQTVRQLWDGYQPLIKAIWEAYNAKTKL